MLEESKEKAPSYPSPESSNFRKSLHNLQQIEDEDAGAKQNVNEEDCSVRGSDFDVGLERSEPNILPPSKILQTLHKIPDADEPAESSQP